MTPSLVIEQHVPAEPSRVWAAWTSAAGLAAWWWPHLADTTYAVDARVGGGYDIRSDSAGIGVRGEFLRLHEPEEIVMTFEWLTDGEAGATERVTVRLEPVDGGTLVRLTHELAATSGAGEGLEQGWRDVLQRLSRLHAEV